jgi:hypothetical protein
MELGGVLEQVLRSQDLEWLSGAIDRVIDIV